MMKKYFSLILFLNVSLIVSIDNKLEKAYIGVPVADLVGEPLALRDHSQSIEETYNTLAWSCYRSDHAANPRLHQLLLHEPVTIVETQGDEVCIEISSAFYISPRTTEPQCRYWTHKKNIIPASSLSKRDRKKLPPPLDFNKKLLPETDRLIHLKYPWHDTQHGITFSAGTRCMTARKRPSNGIVTLHILHPTTRRIVHIGIPHAYVHTSGNKTNVQKVEDCIDLLRSWTQKEGIIPYVLGGCSYTETHTSNIFTKKTNRHLLSYYDRPEQQTIKSGFDCSNLVLRAAQIAGIPYFCKNSYTLCQTLTPLLPEEQLNAGDLIWMPGHVIIIADTKRNTVIEAHSYDGGYGRVHEMPLSKILRGIATCADLEKVYFNKQKLERLDSRGRIQKIYPAFKLLKLASVWQT